MNAKLRAAHEAASAAYDGALKGSGGNVDAAIAAYGAVIRHLLGDLGEANRA